MFGGPVRLSKTVQGVAIPYHAEFQTESPFQCNHYEISRKDFDDFTVTSHSKNDVKQSF